MSRHLLRMIRQPLPQPVRRGATVALLLGVFCALFAGAWPTYGGSLARANFNAGETLTIQPTPTITGPVPSGVTAQPIVAPVKSVNNDTILFWGGQDGNENAVDVTQHNTMLWTPPAFLGTNLDCAGNPASGISSTPTLATVLYKGAPTPMLFVGGNNPAAQTEQESLPIFYALDAATGAVLWSQVLPQPNPALLPYAYIWDSPLVYQGSVYIGVAEASGCPEPQGEFFQLNASTGAIQNTLKIVPDGCVGGDVWGSPTVDTMTNTIYIATGDPDTGAQPPTCTPTAAEPSCPVIPGNYSEAVLAIDATKLTVESCWMVPPNQQITDGDFGSTPTLFQENLDIGGQIQATNMVGVVNKNGVYYAFNRTLPLSVGPVWEYQIA
jgi:outer membrane protein assembly factor BamB